MKHFATALSNHQPIHRGFASVLVSSDSVCLGLGLSRSRSRPVCLILSVSVGLSRSICLGPSVLVCLSRSAHLGLSVCVSLGQDTRMNTPTMSTMQYPPGCAYVHDVDNAIFTGQRNRRRQRLLKSISIFVNSSATIGAHNMCTV